MTSPEKAGEIRLTRFTRSSGCGCKIAPSVLEEILGATTSNAVNGLLLVGNNHRDDAAAYDLGNGTALLSTTDFFMPVVDDPGAFGHIAAANALSDVYAMGGKPLVALAILGWPTDKIPAQMARQVIGGAKLACEKAGIVLAGGHSVESAEPFFGLAVTGTVPVSNIKRNDTARAGDLLYLTKPLGSGILVAAARRDLVEPRDLETAIGWMKTLNDVGEKLGSLAWVHAMTDITGFGLLGHLAEMCRGSALSAELHMEKVPVMTPLGPYTSRFIYPDMTMKIFSSLQHELNELQPDHLFTACDPQTNGGLLIAVDPGQANTLESLLTKHGVSEACLRPIGRMTGQTKPLITVR